MHTQFPLKLVTLWLFNFLLGWLFCRPVGSFLPCDVCVWQPYTMSVSDEWKKNTKKTSWQIGLKNDGQRMTVWRLSYTYWSSFVCFLCRTVLRLAWTIYFSPSDLLRGTSLVRVFETHLPFVLWKNARPLCPTKLQCVLHCTAQVGCNRSCTPLHFSRVNETQPIGVAVRVS